MSTTQTVLGHSTSSDLYKCIDIPAGDHNDVFDLQAIRMAIIHNMVIRSFNAIIVQAAEITPAQVPAFIKWCQQCVTFLHHHHGIEERIYFPMLEEKLGAGAMGDNVEGHKAFMDAFNQFSALCDEIASGKRTYVAADIVNSVRGFAEELFEHLNEELGTLDSKTLRSKISKHDLEFIEKKVGEQIQSDWTFMWDAPYHLVSNEVTHGGWFPPLPAPLIFISKHVFHPFHSDIWTFGPCDKNGVIKPRYAPYEPKKL